MYYDVHKSKGKQSTSTNSFSFFFLSCLYMQKPSQSVYGKDWYRPARRRRRQERKRCGKALFKFRSKHSFDIKTLQKRAGRVILYVSCVSLKNSIFLKIISNIKFNENFAYIKILPKRLYEISIKFQILYIHRKSYTSITNVKNPSKKKKSLIHIHHLAWHKCKITGISKLFTCI